MLHLLQALRLIRLALSCLIWHALKVSKAFTTLAKERCVPKTLSGSNAVTEVVVEITSFMLSSFASTRKKVEVGKHVNEEQNKR